MTWKVYGEVLSASDLTSTNIRSTMKFHKNLFVKAIRTCLILYGNPTFTNMKMKIYDNNTSGNTPSKLKATSINSFQTSDLLQTYAHGLKFIHFEFVPFGVNADDTYHAVLSADSYSPSESSFLAWRNYWPDPVYTTNVDVNSVSFFNAPILITGVVGSEI